MALTPTITFHFEETLSLSDQYLRARALFFDDGIGADDNKSDSHVKDTISLLDVAVVNHQHWLAHIVPSLEVYSWDPDEVNPSGTRHIASGHAAFLSNVTDLGYLDFGNATEEGPATSQTRAVTIKAASQSGVFGVTNLRLWLSSNSGLGTYGDDFSINFDTSRTWTQGSGLASGLAPLLGTSLPVEQNIYRWDGSPYIDCASIDGKSASSDVNVSEYAYLSVNYNDGFAVGSYGSGVGTGPIGNFNFKITYDYFIGGKHYTPVISIVEQAFE